MPRMRSNCLKAVTAGEHDDSDPWMSIVALRSSWLASCRDPECLYLFAGDAFPPGCVWGIWYDEGKLGGKRWVLVSELVEFAQRFPKAGMVSHDGEMGE